MRRETVARVREVRERVEQVAASVTDLLRTTERRAGITPTGVAMAGIAVAGWVLARLLGSRALFLLVYGTVVLIAVAVLLGRRRISVQAARSDLMPRVTVGQLVEVEIELGARRRTSNIMLEEAMAPQLGPSVRVPITTVNPGKKVRHVYRFVPRCRGVYSVGPLYVTTGDPFGLTKTRTEVVRPAEIIVHPSTEPVHDRVLTREWEDPPIRPPVSKPWPTGFDFYGMRDYAFGDDPRRIVWRATARLVDPVTGLGRYVVRESEQGITDRVGIILDTHDRIHQPGDPSETFETAVRVVASLGTRHLRDGFAVTVDANSRRVVNGLRGERNRIRLLDELARVQLEKPPLATVLDRLARDRRRRDLHNVVVTPELDAEAAVRLRVLIDRGTSVLLALVMWADSDPESMGRAASLGCQVVEVEPGMALERAFRGVVGAGARRHG